MSTFVGRTNETLEEIKKYYGSIPKTYYGTADASILPELWDLANQTFITRHADAEDKRICAAIIGHEHHLPGLVEAHYMILKKMGWSRSELTQLLEGQYPERMNERQVLFANLAKALAVNPACASTEIIHKTKEAQPKERVAEIISLISFVRYMSTFVSFYENYENGDWLDLE